MRHVMTNVGTLISFRSSVKSVGKDALMPS
jgi:hypothetical protein